jgi:hypothetical protein
MRQKRIAFGLVVAVFAWLVALILGTPTKPALATDDFEAYQFNMCSYECGKDPNVHPPGSAYTQWGTETVDELLARIEQRVAGGSHWPRIISLDDVCAAAKQRVLDQFPYHFYSMLFTVQKNPTTNSNCSDWGTMILVRTLQYDQSQASRVTFDWPDGNPNVYIHASCSRSIINSETFYGCTSHSTIDPAHITKYKQKMGLLPSSPYNEDNRIPAGDLNQQPSSVYIQDWFDDGWRDGLGAEDDTFYDGRKIDYIFMSGAFGVSASQAYPSNSDHHLMLAVLYWK